MCLCFSLGTWLHLLMMLTALLTYTVYTAWFFQNQLVNHLLVWSINQMPPFCLMSKMITLCLLGFVTYIIGGNQPFGYCRCYTTVKFNIYYHAYVIKATSTYTLFDLENLNRYHSTLYFIRQLCVQSSILTIVPKFHMCNTLYL